MGWIPPGARWYLADIVEVITVEGETGNVVHTNTVLIEADSPEKACRRAIERGKEYEHTYTEPDGKRVITTFHGLRDLNVIHGEPVHGTELIYSRRDDLTPEELEKWISTKEELGVFAPIEPPGGRD
jgi:hypothetical protein